MSDLKPGDRVRVEYEGVVRGVGRRTGRAFVRQDGVSDSTWVPRESCTVIASPVKVGDVLWDIDPVDALPPGTCIRDSGGEVARRTVTRWAIPGFEHLQRSGFFSYPVTVLWLPE